MRYLYAFLLSFMAAVLSAQSPMTFTRHLQQPSEGKGTVVLLQDEEITRLVDNIPVPPKAPETPAKPAPSRPPKAQSNVPATTNAAIQGTETPAEKYTGARVRHKARGYRIQVYAGTGSSDAKRQAKQMESRVRKAFPELSIYCHFKSPRWICRVGDFATREEAEHYLALIRKRKISVEASIVPDTVLIVE